MGIWLGFGAGFLLGGAVTCVLLCCVQLQRIRACRKEIQRLREEG